MRDCPSSLRRNPLRPHPPRGQALENGSGICGYACDGTPLIQHPNPFRQYLSALHLCEKACIVSKNGGFPGFPGFIYDHKGVREEHLAPRLSANDFPHRHFITRLGQCQLGQRCVFAFTVITWVLDDTATFEAIAPGVSHAAAMHVMTGGALLLLARSRDALVSVLDGLSGLMMKLHAVPIDWPSAGPRREGAR